jgi:NAD(P)-dependent dehydrogenase (short-subunit alcohol dehydrogenase family)
LRILRLAIDTHLITARFLLPLLIDRPGGLLIEVTDGTESYNASHYRLSVFYDLAKVAVNRLAFSLGHELQKYGGTAVAVTPGWLRSEMMLENFGVSEMNMEQKSVTSGQLAMRYGFTDIDDSRPDIRRFIEEFREAGREADYKDYR